MNDLNWKTKKEIIIENAYRDPFLTINDLSELADTTSRYVRTILSEANLSLMKLRKEYTRKIENSNIRRDDKLLLSFLQDVPFRTNIKLLHNEKLILNSSKNIEEIISVVKQDYSYISYQHLRNKKPWGLSTIFIYNDFISSKTDKEINYSELLELLYNIISKNNKIRNKNIELSNIEFYIELSNGQIADFLNISSLEPIMCIKQYLIIGSRIGFYQVIYFSSEQVGFSLAKDGELIIKRKNTAS